MDRISCRALQNMWPQALPGFKVDVFASNLENPREIRTAPNGDIFVAEMEAGDIKVFRGMAADGKPQQTVGLRQRPERALRHRLLPAGSESAMDLRR